MHGRNSPSVSPSIVRGDSILENKSPMAVHRKSPNQLTKRATMISMRKLTNSLFDEKSLLSQVIKEEGDQDSLNERK